VLQRHHLELGGGRALDGWHHVGELPNSHQDPASHELSPDLASTLSLNTEHQLELYTNSHSAKEIKKGPAQSTQSGTPPRTTETMDLETFNQLPITMDPTTKALSTSLSDSKLTAELKALNDLHKSLVTSDAPSAVPPPPVPVNPKRSAQVQKLRETANTSYRKGDHAGAIKLYTLGINMAAVRPVWEPSGLVREELCQLYANRAQAYMALRDWPEGAIDAQCSVDLKKVQNPKAWWRRGKCLLEMGRVQEAFEWVEEALEFEGQEQDLVELMAEIEKKM
jgi:translocation protein SEC72